MKLFKMIKQRNAENPGIKGWKAGIKTHLALMLNK